MESRTLWSLAQPPGSIYTWPPRIGTWRPNGRPRCRNPKCGRSSEDRVSPLQIEWTLAYARDPIGDFVWPGLGSDEIVCRRTVAEFLLDRGVRGLELEEVQFIHPRTKKVANAVRTGRTGPSIEFVSLRPKVTVEPDFERSSISIYYVCPECGEAFHKISGTEWCELIHIGTPREAVRHHTRCPGCGVFVPAARIGEHDVFSLKPYLDWMIVTEPLVSALKSAACTNVSWYEIGEVL